MVWTAAGLVRVEDNMIVSFRTQGHTQLGYALIYRFAARSPGNPMMLGWTAW